MLDLSLAAYAAATARLNELTPTCGQCGARGFRSPRIGECTDRIHIAGIRCTAETWAVCRDRLTTPVSHAIPAPLNGLPVYVDPDVPAGELRFVDQAGGTVDIMRLWPASHRLIRTLFGDYTIDEALLDLVGPPPTMGDDDADI